MKTHQRPTFAVKTVTNHHSNQDAITTGNNSPAINISVVESSRVSAIFLAILALILIGITAYVLSIYVLFPRSENWDETIPSKLKFGLTKISFVKVLLGEPSQSAPSFSVFNRDRCQISFIHTTDKPVAVVSGTVQADTVLAAIISHDLYSQDCKAIIVPPFELKWQGFEIGNPGKPLKKAKFQDFGILSSIGTTSDPLTYAFHCEPLLAYVADSPTSQGIRLRDSAGVIAGVNCKIHRSFASLGRYAMQLWLRVPENSAHDNKISILVSQLGQNSQITNGCYVDCQPDEFQRMQGYTDLTLTDVIKFFASEHVDGVVFFPSDFISGRVVNVDACPGSNCGGFQRIFPVRYNEPPKELPKAIPHKARK